MKRSSTLLLCATLAAAFANSFAQPVLPLDPNFNPIITRASGAVRDVAVRDDGKIYVAGSFAAIDGIPRKSIVRLHAAGRVDPSFSAELPEEKIVLDVLALQPDGKLVAGGRFPSHDEGDRCEIIRLNPDGSRDWGFRSGWRGILPLGALALQSDGRIVFSYGGYESNQAVRYIRRLDSSGHDDVSFQPAVLKGDFSGGLAVQADDKIVVWGCFTKINADQRLGLARLNADGTIDSAFNHNLQSDAPQYPWICFSTAALLPDGELIVRGFLAGKDLVRLHSDGSVAESFEGSPASILVQPDGSMVVTYDLFYGGISRLRSDGYRDDAFQPLQEGRAWALLPDGGVLIEHEHHIRKLNHDGTFDGSFAATRMDVPGSVGAMIQQPDGKLVFTGVFSHVNGVPRPGLARFKSDGSLDPSFTPGVEVPRFDFVWDGIAMLGLLRYQPWDEKLIVAGLPGGDDVVGPVPQIVRLNSDGSRDEGFVPEISDAWMVTDLQLQPDGKLFVSWSDLSASNHVARLNSNGSIDPGFHSPATPNYFNRIAVQPDGKLLGSAPFDATNLIVRFNRDGSADTNFAPSHPAFQVDPVLDILVQQDGRIVVVGGYGLVCLNPDGTRDASFGTGGLDGGQPGEVWMHDRVDGAVLTAGGGVAVFGSIRFLDSKCPFLGCESANLVFLDANGRFEGKASHLIKSYWDVTRYSMTTSVLPLSDGGSLVAGPITGDNVPGFDLRRLRPVPVIQSTRLNADNTVSVTIGGELGWTYRIETSTDLMNWVSLRELPSAGAVTQFLDTVLAGQTRRFYRLALAP